LRPVSILAPVATATDRVPTPVHKSRAVFVPLFPRNSCLWLAGVWLPYRHPNPTHPSLAPPLAKVVYLEILVCPLSLPARNSWTRHWSTWKGSLSRGCVRSWLQPRSLQRRISSAGMRYGTSRHEKEVRVVDPCPAIKSRYSVLSCEVLR